MFAVILTVILIMPPDKDDMKQDRIMSSIEECWSTAAAWVAQDAKAAGTVGFQAACMLTPIPGRDG